MIQQLVLAGQLAVIVLVYLFVWRVMRTARTELRNGGAGAVAGAGMASIAAQESTIIPQSEVARARRAAGIGDPRILVMNSDCLRVGVPFTVADGLRFGRSADNDVVIDEPVVSSHHARLQPPGTLVDLDSTNGTTLNGSALKGRAPLRPGDTFQIGSTVFRFEVPT